VNKNRSQNKKFKRLFIDIETSPNVVFSWNVGYKLNIGHDNIISERGIICVCYKYEGENKVHSLKWDNGNDKKLVLEIIKLMQEADEVIGHNGDNYDIKFLRGRALFHGVINMPDLVSIDTLKISRNKFRLNSNRLDYLGKYLGFGGKKDTGGFGLWKDIVLDNSKSAMNKMISYCKRDVVLLEKVYHKLIGFTKSKTHIGVFNGHSKKSCPHCGSTETKSNGSRISASGVKTYRMQCHKACGKYFSISEKAYLETKS